ncbi:hypothetical protein [Pseudoduganella chitinolytica]|uniref:Uncharacterized protein n=1 Tax=Pseudoduganella chitinolytica TaxID=34070 RepID=A0ABY8B415_9BURK|nr:hypothetical protein [Pseudoduganella chitinolytica]WEF30692.1 hypothetical protein PX653_14525 [Pseudoduganella chitinolytica]
MKTIVPSRLLRTVFLADAAASGAIAALHLVLADGAGAGLSGMLGLPAPLLSATGLFLAGYTLLLVVLARSAAIWSAVGWLIVAGNVGWSALSVLLLVTGVLAPAPLGVAYVGAQAAGVLLFALLEWHGLRTSLPRALPGGQVSGAAIGGRAG